MPGNVWVCLNRGLEPYPPDQVGGLVHSHTEFVREFEGGRVERSVLRKKN
jgi:hypothetical protein